MSATTRRDPDCSTHGAFGRGLDHLQYHLDRNEVPKGWPDGVCRDAWCGMWERTGGAYLWHREAEHDPGEPQR